MHTDVTLVDLFEGLPARIVAGEPAVAPTSITEDSRHVEPGAIFVARSGEETDGRRYIHDAVQAGAVAVLHDGKTQLRSDDVVSIVCEDPSAVAAKAAERFYGSPSDALSLVAVTGTNGKTTIASLIQQLLRRTDISCGLISTIAVDDGVNVSPATLTTPPAIELSAVLRRMVDNGCTVAAMEASSHALEQGRMCALRCTVGIFTNLTGDHLDYHGTEEQYAAAKARLFESLDRQATAIVNVDDPLSARMVRDCQASILQTSLDPKGRADFRAEVLELGVHTTRARLYTPDKTIDVTLPLIGRHNLHNALQAYAACVILGADHDGLRTALEACAAPAGRLERVACDGDGPSVFVDYAHTDDALANVLRAVRPIVPDHGRLWVVFGCGGDRDRTKRPRMARIASEHADRVVVTSDNPRTERMDSIIDDIWEGFPPDQCGASFHREPDRRRAIHYAITAAASDDVIVIAGKGHEDYQIIGRVKVPFDDRRIAHEALRARAHVEKAVSG